MKEEGMQAVNLVIYAVLPALLISMNAEFLEASVSQKTENGHKVTVTAYTNSAKCADSNPNITASLLRIKPQHYWKVIALSRDLARGYEFGDKFELWVNGKKYLVEYQDVMPRKHKNKIDFLLPSERKCREFGLNKGILIPLETNTSDADKN
jgi:3D (Asp-Asp-Asp) domain-containing protein